MYGVLLAILIVLHNILLTSSGNIVTLQHFEDSDDFRQDKKVIRQFKMRCSRRYSPGVCANYVTPVWTFVLQELNCTERLGCANIFRGNRFKTYKICMQQCQGLVDMYLQMLGDSRSNDTAHLRKGKGASSRVYLSAVGAQKQRTDSLRQEELEELSFGDYEQGENETHSVVYKELMSNEGIFPHDVDVVDGEIRSQYDLLHP